MLSLWESKRVGREMPSRGDFTPEGLKAQLGNIVLIDVEYSPTRFRYRLIGTEIVNVLSRDSTGKYLDELYDPEFYEMAVNSYQYILEHHRPIRGYGNMTHANKQHVKFEAVDLPLSSDGKTVDMIMKCSHFQELSSQIREMRRIDKD